MNEETIFRLAKPKKKGLLSLVFSRFLIIGILLLLQAMAYFVLFTLIWRSQYARVFSLFIIVFTILAIVYVFSSRMDASAKLTWMLIMSVLPFVGAFLLLYSKLNFGHIALKKRVEAMIEMTRTAIPQSSELLERLDEQGSDTVDLVTYLSRSGCFPVYENTEVKYFPLGEQKFEAMLEELEKAESFIFMEYFIIEEGYMWGKILEILVRKASEGVDVRVMYDGMCEMSTLPANYWKLLEKQGIRSKAFAAIKPVLSSHYNYRDHRKILVIDGKTAFNGGVNLADEYINRIERFGHWKDTAVMLKGEAVRSFTLLFLQMWNTTEKQPEFLPWIQENREASIPAAGSVMPYGDSPLDEDKVGEMIYMDILNRSRDYVHIMTPYLILDGELETALRFAAQGGVDVKLILPGIPDKKMPYALAKSHYPSLTEAGVKIYEYTPGFIHAKVFVSDGIKAVVGTINLDYRSLYHHFECATYMDRVPCIAEIEADFQETLSACRAVTEQTIKNEKLSYKITGFLLKLIAPLL